MTKNDYTKYKLIIDDLYEVEDQLLLDVAKDLDGEKAEAAKQKIAAINSIQDTVNSINLLYLNDELVTYPSESTYIYIQKDEEGKHTCYISPK